MVKVSWRQPGARWRREGESERKRTKRAREKDERAVTKWEEIRQKEASAEGGTRARKRSTGLHSPASETLPIYARHI